MGRASMHGWIALPSEGEVYLEHSVPRQVWVPGTRLVDVERLAGEVADVTGLHVTIDRWDVDEEAQGIEAGVHINAEDLGKVLERLAQASAETFYDRYHKPMDAGDTDFDDEAYAQDVAMALDACGMHWGQFDPHALRTTYEHALHQAVDDIARHPG